ncbi:MAG: cytochrome c3 family protein, partial [Coriobacteriia bacterium]|nr:cytochrome c3 family protein [Coriobacteriia bacterium]
DADATLAEFTCTSCHDPHGSSNYRLLKDTLPGGAVGGYTLAGLPDPYVISSEAGYPANGWEKHVNPNTGGYVPDYTTPRYRNNGNMAENISGWCAGCHEKYTESGTMYDYDKYMAAGTTELPATTIYYRHPVNRVVADITSSSLAVEPTRSDFLPLEVDQAAAAESDWALGDMIGCLTCHRAHGTNVFMSGWSESSLSFETGREPEWSVALDDGSGGTNPNKSSALLRLDNRGVCERCHDK